MYILYSIQSLEFPLLVALSGKAHAMDECAEWLHQTEHHS